MKVAAILSLNFVVVLTIVVVLVLHARSGNRMDLTGKWLAQQGVVVIDLTLQGTGKILTGTLNARNAPLPIHGTVLAQITGTTAKVTVHALGQTVGAHCQVSSTRLVCTGTGGNTTLTLTFTRP